MATCFDAMLMTPVQRSLVAQLEQTLGTADAQHRWKNLADLVLVGSASRSVGSRAAITAALSIATVFYAPLWLPAIAVASIGRSREQRRSRQRIDAGFTRARAILSGLATTQGENVFRCASGLSIHPDSTAADAAKGCCTADRLLAMRASVIAPTRRDPALVFNGVALAALTGDEGRIAFAVWSTNRDPSIDSFFEETRASIRNQLPDRLVTEYWTWTHGSAASFSTSRA